MFPAADHTEHPSHSLIPSHADGRASVTPIFYSAVFQGTNNSRKIVVRTSVRSITTLSFICSASRESLLFFQVHLLNSSSISKISPLRTALISPPARQLQPSPSKTKKTGASSHMRLIRTADLMSQHDLIIWNILHERNIDDPEFPLVLLQDQTVCMIL